MIDVVNESGWEQYYQDGLNVYALYDYSGVEIGGYYEDPTNPDNFHAYLRAGERSGDSMDFSNTVDAREWVETLGENVFDDIYENKEESVGIPIVVESMIDMGKKGKSVSNLTMGDLRKMDLWDEDRVVIVDDNGDCKDVSRIFVDENNGWLYLQ